VGSCTELDYSASRKCVLVATVYGASRGRLIGARPWCCLESASGSGHGRRAPIEPRARLTHSRVPSLPQSVCDSGLMFVTNHVLSGVLIGWPMERRPVAAFLAGVGSHLLLDALPHWGCDLSGVNGPERLLRVAKRDGLLGLTTMAVATFTVDRRARTATVAAMAGAVLLDLDKPFGHFFGVNPLPEVVNRLHRRVQNESPRGMPNEIAYGIAFAAADAIATAIARGRLRSRRVASDLPTWPARPP